MPTGIQYVPSESEKLNVDQNTTDKAVVQNGRFLALDTPEWSQAESQLGYDVLKLTESGQYTLTVFRVFTNLKDFYCAEVREEETGEVVDSSWNFIIGQNLFLVFCSNEILEIPLQIIIAAR
jgi:hypothetical protein